MNNNNSLSTQNQTIPTTVGALLTEEWTIDPLSHLPSFLELTFVDVARNSGRKALSAAWGVGIVWLEGVLDRLHRLERLVDRRLALRLNSSSSSTSSSTTLAATKRLLNIIRTFTAHIQQIRVKLLKSLCHAFLKTIKSLGPEIQTLIMYAIDYNCMHYLAGATACEMVYGLKRSKIIKQSATSNNILNQKEVGGSKVTDLTKFDKTISALLAALLPYCKERCDQLYSEWKEDGQSSTTSSSSQSLSYHRIPNNHTINSTTNQRRTAIDDSSSKPQQVMQIYPYFHMLHEGSIFLYQFAYLMGYTPYWSFSLHALGVMLRRMTVADVQQQQKEKQLKQQQQILATRQKESSPTDIVHNTAIGTPTKNTLLQSKQLTIPRLLRGAVLFSLSYTVLSGWYSHFQRELRLRRRRWIAGNEDSASSQTNNEDDDTRRKAKLPIPPPPMPPNLLNTTIDEGDIDNWSCPICKDVRINPTASTSGYVYCYKCLVLHIRQKGEYCPVTGMHCPENKVVRLFEPTATSRDGTS